MTWDFLCCYYYYLCEKHSISFEVVSYFRSYVPDIRLLWRNVQPLTSMVSTCCCEVRQFDILLLFVGLQMVIICSIRVKTKLNATSAEKNMCFRGFQRKFHDFLYIFCFHHSPLSRWLMTCLVPITAKHRPITTGRYIVFLLL